MLSPRASRGPARWLLVAGVAVVALIAICSALESAAPDAATDAASPADAGPPSLVPTWRLVGSMALVVGLAVAAALVVKRFSPLARNLGGAAKRIQVLEVHALGGKRFLCLVKVDAQELLLGLSPARIDLLTETASADAVDSSPGSFADVAARAEARR
jgi:flagellar protein FliO/FliZ